MAVWYEVEKTATGIHDFMECNWCFHDFVIERETYFPQRGIVELFMKYDELEGSVMLRFIGVKDFHFPAVDEECSELSEASLKLTETGDFIWLSEELYYDIEKVKETAAWVKAGSVLWAVTDDRGVPAEMPENKLEQTWNVYGKIEQKHFSAKPFDGDSTCLE